MDTNSIKFLKMHGTGNDFILIDNMSKRILSEQHGAKIAKLLCERKFGVGADGLIFIEPPSNPQCQFKWRFFNADGSEAQMCGNGGRCAARFAYINNIAPEDMMFETIAGVIKASVKNDIVKLKLPDPQNTKLDIEIDLDDNFTVVHFINTGVPHVVLFVDNIEEIDVKSIGKKIRFHKEFAPEGTNVNFVKLVDKHHICVRTYERGVEDETMACGTGSVASSIITALKKTGKSPINVKTRGGEEIIVHFSVKDSNIEDVFLEAKTTIVYTGYLDGDIKI